MPTVSLSRGTFFEVQDIFPDASPIINAMIDEAVSSGLGIVTLPPGINYLDYPIDIPMGTTDLIVQGHEQGTTLKARAAMTGKAVIQVGQQDNNPSRVWGSGGVPLQDDAVPGTTSLIKATGLSVVIVGKYYALADLDEIPEWDDEEDEWTDIHYRAELVKVIAYNSGTREITLDRLIARPYVAASPESARIYNLEVGDYGVCQNITLRGFSIDGRYDASEGSYAENGIWGQTCDGVVLENLSIVNIKDSCVRFDLSSGVVCGSIDMAADDDPVDEELSRGLNFFRCTPVVARDISADNLRHGVQFSQGNSDFELNGYTATNSEDDSPDLHGGRNIRGLLTNFVTDKSCKVGNVSYPAGDQDITITNGVCAEGIRVQGGSRVSVSNCQAQAALLACIKGYWQYYPNDCTFENCRFVVNSGTSFTATNFACDMFEYNNEDPLYGAEIRRFTGLVFNSCSFEMNRTDTTVWNVFIQDIQGKGNDGETDDGSSQVFFNGCNFLSKRAANAQIFIDKSAVFEGILSISHFRSTLLSLPNSGGGADFACVFATGTESEAVFVDSSFANNGTTTEICDIATDSVEKLVNRNNDPTAWS